MDYSNNGAWSMDRVANSTSRLETLPDSGIAVHRTPRLQKKRSYAGLRSQVQSLAETSNRPLPEHDDFYGGNQFGEGGKARKPSLRNAVRKIFGRKARELDAAPEQPIAFHKHGHHKSEPNTLLPAAELPCSGPQRPPPPSQRVLSVPLPINTALSNRSLRTPNAVEFPHSAKLKPLNLAAPFSAPISPIRRRKTLPSLLHPDDESSKAVDHLQTSQMPRISQDRDALTSDIDGTARRSKRVSRSAEDLKNAPVGRSPPRKRSDEIRFWRESLQSSVLRASGFLVAPPDESLSREYKTASAGRMRDTQGSGTLAREGSSLTQRENEPSQLEFRSASGYGTDLSKDLEDRVAKLELGLNDFQRSLERLTSGQNRQTGLSERVRQRRTSTDARTPSMLIDSLVLGSAINPSASSTGFGSDIPAERPRTSPQPPQSSGYSSWVRSSTDAPPVPRRTQDDDPFTFAAPSSIPIANLGTRAEENRPAQMEDYNFRSLYQMLAGERNARRRLETQLKTLKLEIDELHGQVSMQSNMQSQRSSYFVDPMVGSSRLRDLIRSTESSPISAESESQPRQSGGFEREHQRVVSRFSISESEAGGLAESADGLASPPTPYELYQTPREDRWRFGASPIHQERHAEGTMF